MVSVQFLFNLWWVNQKFIIEMPSKYCIVEFTAIFVCFLLSWSRRDIQWNEVTTLTSRDFNNSWLLYLNFSNIINLCLNISIIKNSKRHQILFRKRKKKKHKFFIFLKGRYFVMGGPINMNVGVFWGTS